MDIDEQVRPEDKAILLIDKSLGIMPGTHTLKRRVLFILKKIFWVLSLCLGSEFLLTPRDENSMGC